MKGKKSSPYSDNCPICDAMRRADEEGRDLSLNDLRTAFEDAAKSKDAVASYINPAFRSRPKSEK